MKSTEQTHSPRGMVLSLGSVNADFQFRVARRPDISETVIGSDFERFGGGKAANVAFLARQLGLSVRLFGHVGDDDLAEQALTPLREVGVDLSDVKRTPGIATGVAMVAVPPDGQKGIVLAANANAAWTPEDAADVVQAIGNAPAEAVLVIDCEVPIFVVSQAAEAARQRGCRIVLDPSPADEVTDALLAAADFVTPNASEAERLTGTECVDVQSATRAGVQLLDRGVAAACIKLPDGGCVMVEKEQVTHVAAVPVKVVDTTGAGDAFAGALAVALIEHCSPIEAVKFAVATSHLTVTRYGSQYALPQREQIQQMLDRLNVQQNDL